MEILAKENKEKLIETIKILTFKEDESLFEKIDFNDDAIFSEPILFSYFNSKNDENNTATIEDVLLGYYTTKANSKLQHCYNKNQIAYVPNLGYYTKDSSTPVDNLLVHGDFEIVKELHLTQEKYLIEFSRGHITNAAPKHNSVWKAHHQELFEAIDIIKKHLPTFYKQLAFANKKIYLHDNPNILNFTSVETLGMLYLYVLGNNNLIYFIEELIHQGSHNYLYYVVHNRKDFFKIDVDRLNMRDFTNQVWDYRTIYGAFHGLFTVTQRLENFDLLLSNNVFSGRAKHELLGRLTDQFSRFQTGLELLNLDEVYTKKGQELYHFLTYKGQKVMNKYKKLKDHFDLSNRDLDFRYDDYCKLNPYEDFLAKEQKGIFVFS